MVGDFSAGGNVYLVLRRDAVEIMLNKVLSRLGVKIEVVDRLISRNLAGLDQTKSAVKNLTSIIM